MIRNKVNVITTKIARQLNPVNPPYGAFNITTLRSRFPWYAERIGSIAKVSGFNDAIQHNQFGMNANGAKAVLANKRGKLTTKNYCYELNMTRQSKSQA